MEEKFVLNDYNVKVKKCCASCRFNGGLVKDLARVCKLGEGIVKNSSVCDRWQMKTGDDAEGNKLIPDFNKAGKGGGRIKKKHYLKFLLNYPQPENAKLEDRISNVQIAKEYEEKHGSIYMI